MGEMRLQWSEIRSRAAAFSAKYAHATRERAETQSFYNDFFECFGVSRRQVAGRAGHEEVKTDSGFAPERGAFRDGG